MKKRIAEVLKNKKKAAATVVTGVVLAAVIGGTAYVGNAPELTSSVDPVMETSISEEEPPLAAKPKVTTKTSKKSSKKKVKLKKASKKTYSKKLPTKKKTSTKTKNTASATVKTQTTVTTDTVEKYKKKSKYKEVNQTITTTVMTTTTQKTNAASTASAPSQKTTAGPSKGAIDVMSAAKKMDPRVLQAYTTLGFTASYDTSVSYAGYYDTKNRSITLRENDDTIYHELGHFLSFLAGNVDTSSNFVAIYNKEKGKYAGVNKTYVTQDSSEYFAESVKDYTLDPDGLRSTRPETYEAIKAALDKVTNTQIKRIQLVYGRIWK